MDVNRYAAAGLALSGAVSLYTLSAIPHGSVAQRWSVPPASSDAASSAGQFFPAGSSPPLVRLPERHSESRRGDSLSFVQAPSNAAENPAARYDVAVSTPLAALRDVAGVDVQTLIDRHPWLGPIGPRKLSLLLRDGEMELRGVWGACARLGLYSECVLACRASGNGCRPE